MDREKAEQQALKSLTQALTKMKVDTNKLPRSRLSYTGLVGWELVGLYQDYESFGGYPDQHVGLLVWCTCQMYQPCAAQLCRAGDSPPTVSL
jgi:hypothetical protein